MHVDDMRDLLLFMFMRYEGHRGRREEEEFIEFNLSESESRPKKQKYGWIDKSFVARIVTRFSLCDAYIQR